ncbi:MAG TPA: aldehyde dehydrogenase family protein [Ilumatobacteraceae bacterium]
MTTTTTNTTTTTTATTITPTTTPIEDITAIVDRARAAFAAGATTPIEWRRSTLTRLRRLVVAHEQRLLDALATDLGKPPAEAWATEIGFVLSDIDHVLGHLDSWVRPRRVATPLTLKPGTSHIHSQPVGVACVIAPWNYPVQLLLVPVIAAISAGCAVIAKPSELSPATADALGALIAELGDPAVALVLGGVTETSELLTHPFGHLLYTGNGRVARIVMRAAAETLTPVTLELGGKSPAIVSRHADIAVAAKRIAWGKFVNAGQTCIAPDYILVEHSVHDELVAGIAAAVVTFYGADPKASADFGRIVNDAHFHRLEKLLANATVAAGGVVDADQRYIAPTVLIGVSLDDPVMNEEIFGPILPVIAVDSIDAAIETVGQRDHPLALYVFSEQDDEVDTVVDRTMSGGVCVNGTLLHVGNPNLPFGGVGESGMGAYHGRAGFDTFSHARSVHTRSTRVDPSLLYPPYTKTKQKLIKRGLLLTDPRELPARLFSRLRRR